MMTRTIASTTSLFAARTRLAFGIGALVAAAGLSTSAGAQVLANSHNDFSGVQGFNGWYYGYFDGDSMTPWSLNDFEQLPYFGTFWHRSNDAAQFWTAVTRDGGHPNGVITSGDRVPEENWSVRRWVSDGTYVLNVFGRAWDANPTAQERDDNGVIAYVMMDGATIWQGTVNAGNEHGLEYDLTLCTVPGTILDFVIDPRDSNDHGDDTGFHSTIRTIIDHQPADTFTCQGGTADFNIATIPGMFTYQWRRNGDPILHDGNLPHLRVVNVGSPVTGLYDCVVTGPCGSMVSDAAMLTICAADFDCDGLLDSQDFFLFLTEFFNLSSGADINQDSFINSQDFFDFLGMFFGGC